MNNKKLFFGIAAGIVVIKALPKTKYYLKPATIKLLSKAITMKDEAVDFFSSINEEALKNRNEKYNKIINENQNGKDLKI